MLMLYLVMLGPDVHLLGVHLFHVYVFSLELELYGILVANKLFSWKIL